ncbi:MAG: class I SAM-dependent methyltransferase [Anaerolineae bacterium]|nr:class I SAM-dependent methyltransferase [Anaerolineae bacterium]
MNSAERFSSKAKLYAEHRLDYHPAAFAHIAHTQPQPLTAWVADVGAGGGEVSRHLVGQVKHIFAIEPNAQMRANAVTRLGQNASVTICAGQAEALCLRNHSLDIITVGRAIHWFNPEQSKAEFKRVLKPDGLLCVLRLPIAPSLLSEATQPFYTEAYGWDTATTTRRKNAPPPHFFFGQNPQRLTWIQEIHEDFEQYFGRISSLSVAPNPSHPQYGLFREAMHGLFEKHSHNGLYTSICTTELFIGTIP